jgi:hypothetical protein
LKIAEKSKTQRENLRKEVIREEELIEIEKMKTKTKIQVKNSKVLNTRKYSEISTSTNHSTSGNFDKSFNF